MEKIVLDTSVVVKWFHQETHSQEALGFLSQFRKGKIQIIAPKIIILELANALFFGAGFDLALVNESLSSFANLSLELVDIDQDLLEKSVQIMIEKQIAIYDCLFLALAKKERCCLITADRKHHLRQVYSRVSYL